MSINSTSHLEKVKECGRKRNANSNAKKNKIKDDLGRLSSCPWSPLRPWDPEAFASWDPGTLELLRPGTLEPLRPGTLGAWSLCVPGPWEPGALAFRIYFVSIHVSTL